MKWDEIVDEKVSTSFRNKILDMAKDEMPHSRGFAFFRNFTSLHFGVAASFVLFILSFNWLGRFLQKSQIEKLEAYDAASFALEDGTIVDESDLLLLAEDIDLLLDLDLLEELEEV